MWPFKEKIEIRTRAAPSPTGFPHIGNLRTALFDYLFAKSSNGSFIIRIEDTDQKRSVEGATEKFLEALLWLGLTWDEGPDLRNSIIVGEKGERGSYWQSRRLDIYKKWVDELLAKNLAYYCFCTPEILDAMRKEQIEKKRLTQYDGRCKELSREEVSNKRKAGKSTVIRLKVPTSRKITFHDYLRGDISINSDEIEDQILMKSDGYPTYHLASVVDDHHMKISHVIRGEEWIASTPKHILLYEFLGWTSPQFVHVPLVLGTDKQKLSKRDGAFSVEDLKLAGYLPEAVLNYLVILGWRKKNDDREIFSKEQLIREFSLDDLNKSPAIFDRKKLDWYNEQYIKELSINELYEKVLPYMEKSKLSNWDKDFLMRVLFVEQSRFKRLTDIEESMKIFLNENDYEPKLLLWKDMNKEEARKTLEALLKVVRSVEQKEWGKESVEQAVKEYIVSNKLSNGNVLWPMRSALTGRKQSPGPYECAYILGKDETIRRLIIAIEKLSAD